MNGREARNSENDIFDGIRGLMHYNEAGSPTCWALAQSLIITHSSEIDVLDLGAHHIQVEWVLPLKVSRSGWSSAKACTGKKFLFLEKTLV